MTLLVRGVKNTPIRLIPAPAIGSPMMNTLSAHISVSTLTVRKNISDLLEFLGIEAEDAYMKDRIFVNPGEINRIVEAGERILAQTGLFYQRAGRVVTIHQQQEVRYSRNLTSTIFQLRWQGYLVGRDTTGESRRVFRLTLY